ncbi:MAG: Stp1/IreP family PP2C-type Ser/Thr phosphatase [Gemmatimonadetes bacterium]|nr:Stp1/IreP family PP2C-type Ser/Thr phosphatase [Gemmatimonadota bacterium]
MHWNAAAVTDTGRRRPGNEDAYLLRPEVGLFAVADGMGGHAAGEVASGMAVEALEREWLETAAGPARSAEAAQRALLGGVQAANREILSRAAAESEKAGMGTTLTALALLPAEPHALIAHVGDSRAYRFLRLGDARPSKLTQLTSDHTWVQEQVQAGILTPAQARRHPYSSLLTRALGIEPEVEVDQLRIDIAPGDLFLLCSDGLTGMIEDRELLPFLERDRPLEERARQLVDEANLRGGPDNVTVLLIRVTADSG